MYKEELLKKYKYKLELHAHTSPVSSCSEIPTDDFVRYFIEDGFDGVVITNHFNPEICARYTDAKKCAEYYLSDYYNAIKAANGKLKIYLGMEIRFTESSNDYLVYGINDEDIVRAHKYIDKGIDIFYREFKNDKNIILQAHPFRDRMTRANINSVDGIEVFNFHPGHNSRIAAAAAYAKENNYYVSGGVDFHHIIQRDIFATRTESLPEDSYDICKILKSRDYICTVSDSVILP